MKKISEGHYRIEMGDKIFLEQEPNSRVRLLVWPSRGGVVVLGTDVMRFGASLKEADEEDIASMQKKGIL